MAYLSFYTRETRRGFFALLLVFALAMSFSGAVGASGILISAPNRVDHVHDTKRNVIYISSQSSLLRFNIATGAFLAPISLGGDLAGMDISPDGDTLAVANRTPNATTDTNSIFLVDLRDGATRTVTFARDFGEGGTWSVAFGGDGRLLISARYEGSGWTPLRRYDLSTNQTTNLTTVYPSELTQDAMLCASGDRSLIGFAESNISDGRWGTYRVSDGALVRRQWYEDGTSAFNYEMGVNASGTQFSIPTFSGTYVYNATYQKVGTIGAGGSNHPIGVAYHPTEAKIYFPWVGTGEVRVYSADTLQPIGNYDFETRFTSNGNRAFVNGRAKVSRDGSLLSVSVAGGVRFVSLLPSSTDTTSPSVAITTPTAHAVVTALPLIQGTTSDNLNGSGVARVEINLQRASDGSYWNGTAWRGASPVALETTLQNGVWKRDTSLPITNTLDETKKLGEGLYRVTATAFDTAGNQKSANNLFTLDKSNPAITIFTPSHRAYISSLNLIAGTATDNTPNGVSRVDLFLKRNADGKYWTGTAWGTATPVALATGFNRGTWGRTSAGLPSVSTSDPNKRLGDGLYTISATAFDKAGNQKSAGSLFFVDRTSPITLTIGQPTNGAVISSLPALKGTALDNPGGSGIARVDLFLKRGSDGKFWTGTAWGTTTGTPFPALPNGGHWSRATSGLPSVAASDLSKRLTSGAYVLTAVAFDKAGNRKTLSISFTLNSTSGEASSAPVL